MPQTAIAGLEVQVRKEGTTVHVRLSGTLDASGAPRVRHDLKPALRDGACAILLDLRDLAYVDGAGVEALVHAARVAQRVGGELTLKSCPDDLRRQLAALGRDHLFRYEG